jgi:uncharacterized membrane protein YoaK (UPF0700 family)
VSVVETLVPRAGSRESLLPPLLVLLTVVTGVVDAVAYLALGHVFVANMTGNVVFLGFAAAGAGGLSVGGSLVALASFLVGAAAGSRLGARLTEDRLSRLRAATAVQLVLCAAAIPVAAVAGDDVGSAGRYALIVPLAIAMGIQNATARRLAVPDLTTTVLTMTLTGIAADSRVAGGSPANTARRVVAVAAMLLGAFVGAVLLRELAPVAAVVLAAALLAAVCGAAWRGTSRVSPA